mgnify:FL=1
MIKLIQKQAIILPNDQVTIVRYSLLGLINKICVNVIYADVENYHSHPWDYISVILWGRYKETQWKDGKTHTKTYYPGSILKRKHDQFHRIVPIGEKAITLFFRGRAKTKSNYWVENNKVYPESKYWLMKGYTKDKMRKLFNYMKEYNN